MKPKSRNLIQNLKPINSRIVYLIQNRQNNPEQNEVIWKWSDTGTHTVIRKWSSETMQSGFPWCSSGLTIGLAMQWMQVHALVRELRSHMPQRN